MKANKMLRKPLVVIVLATSILFPGGCKKHSGETLPSQKLFQKVEEGGAEAKKEINEGNITKKLELGPSELQAISVRVTVPDLGWIINIDEIYKVEGELWVVSVLHRTSGLFGQQITTKSDTVKVPHSSLPVKHFVLGKTWGWQNEEPYVFLNSRDEIAEELESGKLVFKNGVDQ
jgi:hypothetical protein